MPGHRRPTGDRRLSHADPVGPTVGACRRTSIVVDHHDSYTWNLVHLVAPVTGRPPAGGAARRGRARRTCCRTRTSCSRPAPATRPSRPTSRSAARCCSPARGRCWASASACRAWSTAYGGTVDRVEPAHGDVATDPARRAGVFAGLPHGFEAVRYHSLAARPARRRCVATAWSEDGVVMGVRHRRLPLEGVQFHPESILSEHGRDARENFRRRTDPVAFFRAVAAAHRRCFWLDGGGAREWSGRRSIIGWLDDDDVSLTLRRRAPRGDAARRRLELVGRRRRHLRRARGADAVPGEQWFGYFGYACRPDLPARPDPPCPTRCGCGRGTCGSSSTPRRRFRRLAAGRSGGTSTSATSVVAGLRRASVSLETTGPAGVRRRVRDVQEHLRAGNSYEVNLTYRLARRRPTSTR